MNHAGDTEFRQRRQAGLNMAGQTMASAEAAIPALDFTCAIRLPVPSVLSAAPCLEAVVAVLRAGGLPLLDLPAGFTAADLAEWAAKLTDRLLPSLSPANLGSVGAPLPLLAFRAEAGMPGLATLAEAQARHWPGALLLITCADTTALQAACALPAAQDLWIESGNMAVLRQAAADSRVSGLVAVGEEAGGWCGEMSSLLLGRAMARLGDELEAMPPWLLRGGLGVQGAAAAHVAGAAGVVLDDILWLLPEIALPEFGLGAQRRRLLESLDGKEAAVLGEAFGAPLRILLHPHFPASRALEARALEIEAAGLEPDAARRAWIEAAQTALATPDAVWPLGQGIGLAKIMRDSHGSLGRLVAAVRAVPRALAQQAPILATQFAAEQAPLAQAHRSRYPLVQGPMTRVSDVPGFAHAVAAGGGLPMIALAVLKPDEVRRVLQETKAALGEQSWGVGLLGFLPPDQLDAQMAEVLAAKPPFALIAGGRAEQALHLEAQGIVTYVHAPTPALARMLVERGVKRLVLEGRECGGHVGPLHSLLLWENIGAELLKTKQPGDLSLLLAGGVHDGLTAAMAAAALAPLVAAGAKIGCLMGTAYLATEEITATGAITPAFQQAVVAATGTSNLESGRGHANRCLATPFADFFQAERRRLLRQGLSGDALREALDDLLLGRLRVAAKGVERQGADLVAVDAMRQQAEGMFMAGEAAAQIGQVSSIAALHVEVCDGAAARLGALAGQDAAPASSGAACDIAIIGMAMHVPGATSHHGFWRNVLDKNVAIREIPADKWDWRLYYSAERNKPDHISSRWGGFMDGLAFDPLRYGIPPKAVPDIAPGQLLTLEMVRRALIDAGYETRSFDREHTAVIVAGEDAGGYLGNELIARALAPLVSDAAAVAQVRAHTQGWSEEVFPGILTSVVAGRIANRFDFGGANFTVDSACASSITALSLAVSELSSGRANVAVLAGTDTTQTPYHYTAFSAVSALSPSGKLRAFDQSADGTVLGEGVAAFILKRRIDAERDGDRIYAVIKAVASSSDGKGLGMTAPRPIGQKRALRRAYEAAGHSIAGLGFYEAHGTGTAVGDRAELETVGGLLKDAGAAAQSCALGSVKALIGHAKTAAGAVGLAKVALALHHRTIPPQPGIERPLQPIGQADSPLYVSDGALPWFGDERPRRAGLSAFGFGGTNAHAVLEEYDPGSAATAGAAAWPAYLFAGSAADKAGLLREIALLERAARHDTPDGASIELFEIAAALAERLDPAAAWGFTLVATGKAPLLEGLAAIRRHLEDAAQPLPQDAWAGARKAAGAMPLALLFPGQGSQRLQMCRDIAVYMPELRASIEAAEAQAANMLPDRLSRLIYPPAVFDGAAREAQAAKLTNTAVAQIALGAVEAGLIDLLHRLGARPAFAAGHSYGEYAALYAGGAMDRATLFKLSLARGRAMAAAPAGRMCAVSASREALQPRLAAFPNVVIANINSDKQIVLSGASTEIESLVALLEGEGIPCRLLNVGGAFHSPLMRDAQAPLGAAIAAATLKPPSRLAVHATRDGRPFPDDVLALKSQLAAQMTDAVDFVAQVRGLFAAGARLFVELGPGGVLAHLTKQILKDGDARVLHVDDGGGLRGLLRVLAVLWAEGQPLDLARLLPQAASRPLETLAELATREAAITTWIIDAMQVRPARSDSPFKSHRPALRDATSPAAMPASQNNPSQTNHGDNMAAERPPNIGAGSMGGGSELLAAYAEYQATMRQFLQTQEQVMNLMLGGQPAAPIPYAAPAPMPVLPAAMPAPVPAPVAMAAPAPVAAAPVAAAPVAAAAPRLDKSGAEALLRDIVSERTGYPLAMIDLEQDIEAELGVDSIKRLEMIERVLAALPPPASQRFRAGAERTARVKVLRQWVEAILAALEDESGGAKDVAADVAASVPVPADAAQSSSTAPAIDSCPAFAMAPRLAPLPANMPWRLKGLFLLLPGPEAITHEIARALASRGLVVAVLPEEPAAQAEAIRAARAEHGPVRGLVQLSGFSIPEDMAWSEANARGVKALYRAVQLVLEDLAAPHPVKSRVFACSSLGGCFGRSDFGAAAPASLAACSAGAALGFLNTLAIEHPAIAARALDFAPDMAAARLADILLAELAFEPGRVEVGYAPLGRTVFEAQPFAYAGTSTAAAIPGGVILATGGVRGITAAMLAASAAPGTTLIALGRRGLPEADPHPDCLEANALRKRLAEQALASGQAVKPAEIAARAEAILRDREAAQALAALQQAGLRVEVRGVDTRDPAALSALLDDVQTRFGAIGTLVHGAGVIEDKLIQDKQPDSFDRVFETKVAPLPILLGHPALAKLERLVLFSSIAGRFGNRGQGDYAAANELLNRAALWFTAAHPAVKVVSYNWGPWGGTGMASAAVNEQFRQRGIVPIPLAGGVALACHALRESGPVELIAGEGDWNRDLADESAALNRVESPMLQAGTLQGE